MNQKSGSKSVAWKFRFATLFFIFSVLLSISIAGFGTIMASGAAVGIDPASQEVSAGDTFTVNVTVDPAGYGVSSGSVKIVFDAAVMQVDSVVAGDLLGASPIVPSGFPKIDNTNGTVYVELARAGVTPVPTAKGTFATITFTVRSIAPPGTYAIDITTAVFADENYADISGITLNNGTVTVTTVDTTPPTIEFIAPTPADGSTVTVNYVNVTVNVTDPSGVSTVLLNWNGLNETMNMTADNTWSVNKTGLSNGDYTFKVYANDTAGNMGVSETRVVTVNVGAAEHEGVYLEPQSSSASCGGETEVQIWVNATNFQSGQINLTYDPTCVNVTNWAENTATFPVGTWTHSTGGEWITFASMSSLSGEYKIGTLTIQCVCEDECSTTLNFVDPSKLFDPSGGEIAGVTWTDGTFECTSGICGDVAPYPGGDGVINMGDVILLLNHVGNPEEFPLECC